MKSNRILAILALLGGFGIQAVAQTVVTDTLEFDKAMATTPATILTGTVSGVRVSATDGNINGAVNTYIRGINTLRGDSQPLWIVDGVIINTSLTDNNDAFFQYDEQSYTSPLNALAYINPYDIESIEVIKDLSATAIYGGKGANGVIIVNTKMPKSGLFNVNWNSNIGLIGGNVSRNLKFPDVFEAQGLSHNHSISLNGASGQTKYNVSAFYRKHIGPVARNNQSFGGIRAKFDTHANSVVWFGMDATFTMGDMSSIAGTSYFGKPSLTLAMRNNDYFLEDKKAGWASDYDDDAHDRRGTTSIYVTLNFTPALSWTTSAGIDIQNNNRYIWYGNGTSFGKYNNGAASVLSTAVFKYQGKSVLSWNRYFGTRHHVKAEAGAEANGDMVKYNTINGTDFFSHVLRAKGISLSASAPSISKYNFDYFTWGFFGDLAYSFDGIAGVNAIVRADNTPRYDDKKFEVFMGGDVFFDIRKAFFKDSYGVSALKIKGGYGEAGREKFVPYGMYGNYLPGGYPAVEPEYEAFYEGFNRVRSKEINAGIELGFFGDRLTITAGYYDKSTRDSFFSYCFGALGKDAAYLWEKTARKEDFTQSSEIANRGIEGDISVRIFDKPDLKWTVSANGAYNVNQMIEVAAGDKYGKSIGSGIIINSNSIGRTVGSLYGYKLDADGNIKDLNGNSRIDIYDQTIIGNPVPKFVGGLNTTFRYKNFTAEIFTDMAFGFDILNLNNVLFDDATVITDKYVEKGDYFRIGRISLGYNIPFKSKCFIKGIKLSASALNVFSFKKYGGWNPDVNCYGTSALSIGADYGSYPTARGVVFGVGLNF